MRLFYETQFPLSKIYAPMLRTYDFLDHGLTLFLSHFLNPDDMQHQQPKILPIPSALYQYPKPKTFFSSPQLTLLQIIFIAALQKCYIKIFKCYNKSDAIFFEVLF